VSRSTIAEAGANLSGTCGRLPRGLISRALSVRRLAAASLVMLSTLAASAVRAEVAAAPPPPPPPPLEWRNPLLAADFPDPSVARIGDVYWAAATSTARAPGFPLMRSTDLVHWEAAGAVFSAPPAWASDSLWAPELVVDPTGVRVYYTARRRGGPLCIAVASAPGPPGPYTDHGPLECQAAGSIDPTFVRDAGGRPYLVWKEDGNAVGRPSRIWIRRLRADGLSLIGGRRELLQNASRWEGSVVEAPEIVPHGDQLYLFYSGNRYGPAPRCRYAVGVARSRSIFGPWKRDPDNPILRSNRSWRCPGHAAAVTDRAGRVFLLYHAYRGPRTDPQAPRQLLMDAVGWSRDGWPSVNGGRGPSVAARVG
jgi:xylan 1,4-beta-xylosidase